MRRNGRGATGAEPCLAQVDDLIVIVVCSNMVLWKMQEILSGEEDLAAENAKIAEIGTYDCFEARSPETFRGASRRLRRRA